MKREAIGSGHRQTGGETLSLPAEPVHLSSLSQSLCQHTDHMSFECVYPDVQFQFPFVFDFPSFILFLSDVQF